MTLINLRVFHLFTAHRCTAGRFYKLDSFGLYDRRDTKAKCRSVTVTQEFNFAGKFYISAVLVAINTSGCISIQLVGIMEGKPQTSSRTPSDFLNSVIGRQVLVKLNSGIDYKGISSIPADVWIRCNTLE